MPFVPLWQLYWPQNIHQQSLFSQVGLLSDNIPLSSSPKVLCLHGIYHLMSEAFFLSFVINLLSVSFLSVCPYSTQ